MLHPVWFVALTVSLVALVTACIAPSTSHRHSLQAIDCVIVGAGTGPWHQSFEVCPPLLGAGTIRPAVWNGSSDAKRIL